MKQLYYTMLCIFIGALSLVSCRWESQETFIDPCNSTITWTSAPQDTCFDLPINGLGMIEATLHWPVIIYPHYCPHDANRFVLITADFIGGDVFIYSVNLCSGEKQIVTSANNIKYARWGAADWILFNAGTGPLYRVKSNGDSLTLLNNLNRMSGYFWINDGQNIFTKWQNNSLQYNLLLNINGEILDTVATPITGGAYRNSLIATVSNYQGNPYLGVLSLADFQFTPLAVYELNSGLPSIDWLNDNSIIWSNYKGIHILDISTTQITTIKATPCHNLRYASISAAQDNSSKILTTRIEYIYVRPDSLVEYQRISLLDTNTGQERILGLE